MPIRGNKRRFVDKNINNSPTDAGVYALYDHRELIYIGRGEGQSGIRTRLLYHMSENNPCTADATSYCCERSSNPARRERYLLEEYEKRYHRLPRCNERIG